jgi:REP element-mobilizing transposase RayT
MPAYARREIVPSDEIGVYHCIARCVRRAFLCGVDPVTEHDYEHRKDWVHQRLEKLASVFAIDVCSYAVMSNHLHVVLRVRPDLAADWSAEEVALCWTRLYPPRDPATGRPAEPSQCDLNMILSDPARVAVIRERLSSMSWFMRCLCEPIARRANHEDQCTGRFWEGRFKSQALLDEGAILACSVYVDLNPVRAGVTETPEQSKHTSAFVRIQSLARTAAAVADGSARRSVELPSIGSAEQTSPVVQPRPDAWLCELTTQEGPAEIADKKAPAAVDTHDESALVGSLDDSAAAKVPTGSPCLPHPGMRASDQGYLPIPLDNYLALLDWTCFQIRGAGQQAVPDHLPPILERLGLKIDSWVETVRQFGRWFKTAVGRRDSLRTLAEQRGKAWLQGQAAAALAFR